MPQRALYGERSHAAQTAQRSLDHELAELLEPAYVAGCFLPRNDPVDDFHRPRRADAAGSAFAAGFDGAELHGIARHPRHVHGVVECDYAAVAEQRAYGAERLVVHERIELRGRNVSPERPADLHRAQRAPGSRAAAVSLEQLAQRQAEGALD